jgi:hypothetical protein
MNNIKGDINEWLDKLIQEELEAINASDPPTKKEIKEAGERAVRRAKIEIDEMFKNIPRH